jgi:hypothetical protein
MKKKWKWLILLCLPVLIFAVWLWTVGGRQIPVDVFGELPEKDVAEIVTLVKRQMRRHILPKVSWKNLKRVPSELKEYLKTKLITIDWCNPGTNREFADVWIWSNTNGMPRWTSDSKLSVNGKITPLGSEIADFASSNGANAIILERRSNGWIILVSSYEF